MIDLKFPESRLYREPIRGCKYHPALADGACHWCDEAVAARSNLSVGTVWAIKEALRGLSRAFARLHEGRVRAARGALHWAQADADAAEKVAKRREVSRLYREPIRGCKQHPALADGDCHWCDEAIAIRSDLPVGSIRAIKDALWFLGRGFALLHEGRLRGVHISLKWVQRHIGNAEQVAKRREVSLLSELQAMRRNRPSTSLSFPDRGVLVDQECQRRAEAAGYTPDAECLARLRPGAERRIDLCAEQARLVGYWLHTWLDGARSEQDRNNPRRFAGPYS